MKDENFRKFLKERGLEKEFAENAQSALALSNRIVSEMFLDAVRRFDGNKIIEIAQAVWFMKDFFRGGFVESNFKDVERSRLVLLRAQLEFAGAKMTIKEVAIHLAGKNVETPADGFSTLRRKCKEIGVPLVESRKTGKK